MKTNAEFYDENFYRGQKDESYRSASIVAPLVVDLIHPKTMIDVGCGVGTWVRAFQELGVDAYGIDGDYVDRKQLMINEKKFFPQNLEERINIDTKLDLVSTLEVAEHLSPARAETFVEDLTKISDIVLFSAAIVSQGGVNHINEQFQSYWQNIFKKHDFIAVDYIRSKIWGDGRVSFWYQQNILLYVKESSMYRYPRLMDFYLKHQDSQIIDIVNPTIYLWRTQQFQQAMNIINNMQQKISELSAENEKLKDTPPPPNLINFFRVCRSNLISTRIFFLQI